MDLLLNSYHSCSQQNGGPSRLIGGEIFRCSMLMRLHRGLRFSAFASYTSTASSIRSIGKRSPVNIVSKISFSVHCGLFFPCNYPCVSSAMRRRNCAVSPGKKTSLAASGLLPLIGVGLISLAAQSGTDA
jgi:hypothetical protein